MRAEFSWVYRIFSSLSVLFMTMDNEFQGVEGASADVDHHLEMGKRLLAAGQLTEALSHYHSAVEGDPDNYMTYFRRATVLLALGRSKAALPDLNKVVKLRPDFLKARVQRANILLKQGELEAAADDYLEVLRRDPRDQEAKENFQLIEELKVHIENAHDMYENGQYHMVIETLQKPIESCPWNPELREMRADSYEHIGELFKAIQDLRPTTKIRNDHTEGYLKISQLYYAIGEGEDSLREIRECLKLDQDHKRCHQHYKKVKKLVKFFQDAQKYMDQKQYNDALLKLKAAFKLEKSNIKFVTNMKEKMCHCYTQLQENKEAIKLCTETIELEPNNVNAYCDRADAYLLVDDLDSALKDFQKAKEINGEMRRAKEGIDRVNRLIKQSKKRDYFKILGVTRSSSKSEILKKYRKLAGKWHPDKYEGEDRKNAEKKFIDLAAAKEVLTDPEKRAKYEQGEDPLDPESQQGHGHNPFQQGFDFSDFQGFSGFKFHFN